MMLSSHADDRDVVTVHTVDHPQRTLQNGRSMSPADRTGPPLDPVGTGNTTAHHRTPPPTRRHTLAPTPSPPNPNPSSTSTARTVSGHRRLASRRDRTPWDR